MICPLCPDPLVQAPLTQWHGLPAHADCVTRYAAAEALLLAEVEQYIADEHAKQRARRAVR